MSVRTGAAAACCFLVAAPFLAADPNLPLGGGPAGIEGLTAPLADGAQSTLVPDAKGDDGRPIVLLALAKQDEERRFFPLEAKLRGDPTGARALQLRYRLALTAGQAPRPAFVAYEREGGVWFKVGQPAAVGEWTDGRLSLGSLRPAAFSQDASGALEWDQVEKVWVGFLFDGPAEGTLSVAEARFTDQPYQPTQPLRITGDGAGQWAAGQDPAVQSSLTTPNEGPNGEPCLKYEFTLPGGRHMYAIPAIAMPAADLEGYSALRFTYKATIPEGINGLLVMLGEQGAQWLADPPPQPSAEWTTITIPFDRFQLGAWTKDDNGQLDVEEVDRVFIGCHGAAAGAGGTGTIWVRDVEWVP